MAGEHYYDSPIKVKALVNVAGNDGDLKAGEVYTAIGTYKRYNREHYIIERQGMDDITWGVDLFERLYTDDEYIQLARDEHGTAVRDNSREQLIEIGKGLV
jgi:hypothetical protein